MKKQTKKDEPMKEVVFPESTSLREFFESASKMGKIVDIELSFPEEKAQPAESPTK